MDEVKAPAPDKLWYLKRINLFRDLSPEDIQLIANTTEMHHLASRQTVFTPGEEAGRIYLLKAGRIRLGVLSAAGRELTLAYLEPGEIFGELSGEYEEHASIAEAVEPTVICTMSRKAFEEFIAARPSLSLGVAKFVGFRLRRIQARLQDLMFLDVRSRILKVLRDLSEDYGVVTPRGIVIRLRLTHQDVAKLIGATRETTTATISELRAAGQLDQEGKQFVLPLDRSQ